MTFTEKSMLESKGLIFEYEIKASSPEIVELIEDGIVDLVDELDSAQLKSFHQLSRIGSPDRSSTISRLDDAIELMCMCHEVDPESGHRPTVRIHGMQDNLMSPEFWPECF